MKRTKVTLSLFLVLSLIMTTGCFLLNPKRATATDNISFRAIWVASVYNLDYPSKVTSDVNSLKTQADTILDNCKKMGMNAVILQVRPSSDALYKSNLFPWSRFLTGTCGKAPNDDFDPLAYWVSEAHKRGIELHAWINPYRVTTSKEAEYESLPSNHPAKLHPDWVVKYSDGNYYYDPGIPAVRDFIEQGAEEIAKNYDVDGIHMDDYFYPGATFDDADTYATYGVNYSEIGDFRRDSVNALIREMHQKLHAIKPDISFGVSPFGIWANNASYAEGSATKGNQSYLAHYADSKKWVEEGWVDYICPQIYWYIGHPTADYDTLVNWWADVVKNTNVKLYIGMADYQAGNEDSTSPWYGMDAIQKELNLNRTISQVSGEVHYAYHSVVNNSNLFNYYQKFYASHSTDTSTQTPSTEPSTTPTPSNKPTVTIPWKLDQINHNGYMQGSDNMFRPDDGLTRAEAAMIFSKLIVDENNKSIFNSNSAYQYSFSDVSRDAWYAGAVGFMEQFGIVSGYDDGTFRPDYKVSRAEFVTMAYLAAQVNEKMKADFNDVPTSHWANYYIGYAKSQNWVNGYEDGTFKPNALVTRAEVAKIVNGMLKRQPDKAYIDKACKGIFSDVATTHWAYYDIIEAAVSHEYSKNNQEEIWNNVLKID